MQRRRLTSEIAAVYYALQESDIDSAQFGCIAVDKPQLDPRQFPNYKLNIVDNELELINQIIDTVMDLDPDIVLGWEIQASSWGYLAARAEQYGTDSLFSKSASPISRHRNGYCGHDIQSTYKTWR